jgi:acyl-CoA thioester hydrolase
VTVRTRLLAYDAKRLVLFHEMVCAGLDGPAAENEVLCVHVDLVRRRSAPWPQAAAEALARAVATAARLPSPAGAGRAIDLATRPAA